jgi:hypothetical protein
MRRYLETRNIDPAHARKIAAWVYNDPILNRYPYETYIRLLKETDLSIVKLNETSWGEPPKDVLNRLAEIDGKKRNPIARFFRRRKPAINKNHSTGEIEVILRK